MCDPILFQTFSALNFDNLVAKAKAENIDITGDSGTVEYKKVTVSYSYNRDREELTLQCIKKPMLYPCGSVNDKLKELVTGG